VAPAGPPRRFPWEAAAGVGLALGAAWLAWRLAHVLDLRVIAGNWRFLLLQGFLGIGQFAGGTLRLAVPAILFGFALGILIGVARLAASAWIRVPALVYVEFFRGVPLVMIIFWFWFILPQLLQLPIPEYGVALTAFVVFEAAYFGEIVRAGVQSVPRGQVEAARALGLTGAQSMRWVVLPQALRNMVPSLVTQMIVLFKDTSLASIIGYVDLTKAAQIVNNREIRPFELYLFIAVVYWVCTYAMSRFARRFEARTATA
jgi:His/Glu/Gln/Arg/opine family amino acid ABC transporter permease subunit